MTDTPPNDTTSDATAPAAKSVGKKAGGLRKAADKSARTRAREFGVQALYQYLVGQNTLRVLTPSPAISLVFTKPTACTLTPY